MARVTVIGWARTITYCWTAVNNGRLEVRGHIINMYNISVNEETESSTSKLFVRPDRIEVNQIAKG